MSLDVDELMPTQKDLDFRIDTNKQKDGLTLDEIRKDTVRLRNEMQAMELRGKIQAKIYMDLIERIDERIKAGEK